jgi:hypothetical protein
LENAAYTLGRPEPGEYSDRARFRLTIQAAVTASEFDVPVAVSYSLRETGRYAPFGRRFELVEPINQDEPAEITGEAIIYVVPAEEMLRDLMTMIRYIVRDIGHFQPYGIRNPLILYTNYPTSSTISQTSPENLVFHRAETVIEFDIYESNLARSNEGLFIVETMKALLVDDETTEVDFDNLTNYFVPPEDEEWDRGLVPDTVDIYTPSQYPGYVKPTLSISAQSSTLDEDTGEVEYQFVVSRSGNLSATSSVSWQVTGTGPIPAEAIHFEDSIFPSGSLEFLADEFTKQLSFKTIENLSLDLDASFSLNLLNPSIGTQILKGRAVGVILSDD